MKIAMIGQRGVPATFGGVERHVEEIGARLAEDGHQVVVFCRRGYAESRPASYRGMTLVHQHTVDSKHLESFVASGTAAAATLGRGFDVVHFHAVGPGLFAPLVRCFSRARVVQTIHGLDGERAKWGRGASGLLRFGTWLSAKVPHATIVVSKALQDAYRERYGRETVHIVNGAPEVSARPAAAITERWGLTKGSYVLFVGRLVPEKAPDQLLSAFADVPGDTRLVVAGGSSHTDEYVADLHAAAAADPRIIMAGYVYGAELEELYSNAAAFVLPSLLEGLPLTLLEAASYGCSIVASDIPPHVEVVGSSGPGGRLFPAGDTHALAKQIIEALQAPADEERAGALALSERVCSTYSWERAAADTEALYERLLQRRGPGLRARLGRRGGRAGQPAAGSRA
ncbi:MAG TPA: glycosyltransferase family 4 protein [Acidimicrobiales bacterium]